MSVVALLCFLHIIFACKQDARYSKCFFILYIAAVIYFFVFLLFAGFNFNIALKEPQPISIYWFYLLDNYVVMSTKSK